MSYASSWLCRNMFFETECQAPVPSEASFNTIGSAWLMIQLSLVIASCRSFCKVE